MGFVPYPMQTIHFAFVFFSAAVGFSDATSGKCLIRNSWQARLTMSLTDANSSPLFTSPSSFLFNHGLTVAQMVALLRNCFPSAAGGFSSVVCFFILTTYCITSACKYISASLRLALYDLSITIVIFISPKNSMSVLQWHYQE